MDPVERFGSIVRAPEPDIRLDEAAFCIAACACPEARPPLDIDEWCARIDALAAASPEPTFDAVRTLLFVTEGFRGNADDYGDPRNSFLDAVIERRCGIPITLSVLLIEVARRNGIEVLGIGMPGHFLVREAAVGDRWYDPFHGGARLELLDCARLFAALHGAIRPLEAADLAPTPPRAILARMLANLEQGRFGTDPGNLANVVRVAPRDPRRPCAAAGATAACVGARRRSRTRRARLRGSRGVGAGRHRRRAADRGSSAAVALELTCGADMATRVLPMFPLGTVLFPHAVLPLHVFEPRYRVMMRRCIEGEREFGVVLIERGNEVGGGDTRFDIGTVAHIVQAAELEDGRYAIAAVGLGRFQIVRWLAEDPYPNAEVEVLEEGAPLAGADAARDRVFAAFGDVLELWHVLDDRVPTAVPPPSSDATRDLFEVAATAPLGPLDAQRVLEAAPESRAVLLEQLLADLVEELRARIHFE